MSPKAALDFVLVCLLPTSRGFSRTITLNLNLILSCYIPTPLGNGLSVTLRIALSISCYDS